MEEKLDAVSWFNPADGETLLGTMQKDGIFHPPAGWEDSVLMIKQATD
jgi:hypothetical protein